MTAGPRFAIRVVALACLALAAGAGCWSKAGDSPRDPLEFAWREFQGLPQQAPTSDSELLWYEAVATWRMRDERAFQRFGRPQSAAAFVDDVYGEELRAVVNRKRAVEILGGETAPTTRDVRAGRAFALPVAAEIVEEVSRQVAARLDEAHPWSFVTTSDRSPARRPRARAPAQSKQCDETRKYHGSLRRALLVPLATRDPVTHATLIEEGGPRNDVG